MYHRGYGMDWQYDWVIKKAGKEVDRNDFADPIKGVKSEVMTLDVPVEEEKKE